MPFQIKGTLLNLIPRPKGSCEGEVVVEVGPGLDTQLTQVVCAIAHAARGFILAEVGLHLPLSV